MQVLVYKQEKLQARLQYLHSIGLSRAQLVAIATCNPQILSLDIADNLAPKVRWILGQGWSVRGLWHHLACRSSAYLQNTLTCKLQACNFSLCQSPGSQPMSQLWSRSTSFAQVLQQGDPQAGGRMTHVHSTPCCLLQVQYMMTQLGSSTEELARSPAFLMKSLHQRYALLSHTPQHC